jgi:hypothetical protein
MPFEKHLSEQAKNKRMMETPFQHIQSVAKVREEIFGSPGNPGNPGIVKPGDWERLDKAERKADIARELFRNGTLER